jgi:hypothetical protein
LIDLVGVRHVWELGGDPACAAHVLVKVCANSMEFGRGDMHGGKSQQTQLKKRHGRGPREALDAGCTEFACSIPKIQILKFSQTCSKFKMNFKFHFKMFVCELISTNKV